MPVNGIMAANFELLVIGDDAPSLAAAAAAAASGASTALASAGAPTDIGPSVCDIPNFVWRRLDLQEFGLEVEPVSARVTLLADGKATMTMRSARESVEALRDVDSDGAAMWPALIDDMQALGEDGIAPDPSASPDMLARLNDLRALGNIARLAGTGEELIDDFVNGGPLSTHIQAHALAPFGLGGVETGSASAFPEFFDEHAWRVRAKSGTRSIVGALRKACESHGVVAAPAEIQLVSADGAKHNSILFENSEKIRSRRIFFASPDAAQAAGYAPPGQSGPVNGARAVMRIKLHDRIEAPAGDCRAVFQIVDEASDIKKARQDALEGRISERLPVTFEFTDKGDIVARTSFAPKRLQEEGEWRPWTGQDRQVLSTVFLNRLASRIDGLHEQIRKTDLKVMDRVHLDTGRFAQARNIYLQSRRHNAIAAAVKLIDKALADG